MKVQIITRHAVPNYGSFLQAFATQKTIENCGVEAEILDYIRQDEKTKNVAKALLPYSNYANAGKVKKCAYYVIQTANIFLADKKFASFRKKYLNLTAEYNSDAHLKNAPDADIYCTGSDQLWGPIGNDKNDLAYFLNYKSGRKISYAASFGSSEVDSDVLEKEKDLLKEYENITVREKSASEILEKIGISSRVVLDPTLLMNSEEWDKALSVNHTKKEKYVLVYQIHRNEEMDAYASDFAKKAGLKLLRVTPTIYQAMRSGKTVLLPSPGEFLNLISEAEYLITNSFHGTAFALQYHVPMICISSGKTMTRIENLLSLVDFQDRILASFDDYSFLDKKIDFSKSDKILASEREKSKEILKEILKSV